MIEIDTVIEAEAWESAGLPGLAEAAVRATLLHHEIATAEVVVMGCDDATIAGLNGEFRGKARPTNVLTWPSAERGAERDGERPAAPLEVELGDIAIAWETCAAEAEAAGISIDRHATHLLVHATLHLLGYDHERPADGDLMEQLEIEILAGLGLPDPYGDTGDSPPATVR